MKIGQVTQVTCFFYMAASSSLNSDTYNTIAAPSTGEYREKGSRFLSFAYPVNDEDTINTLLHQLNDLHPDARHLCYAWCLGPARESSRMNDDGEPSGTAGRPIMGQLHSFGITNALVAVVRYFGGTLLGTGGLTTAYKVAAREALLQARMIEKSIDRYFEVQFAYEQTRELQRILRNVSCNIYREEYGNTCLYWISVRKNFAEIFLQRIGQMQGLQIKELEEQIH
jgi:uncharacterized YigZ family protein